MGQKHNIQLANFDMASLRVISFRWRCLMPKRPSDVSRPAAAYRFLFEVDGEICRYLLESRSHFKINGWLFFGALARYFRDDERSPRFIRWTLMSLYKSPLLWRRWDFVPAYRVLAAGCYS